MSIVFRALAILVLPSSLLCQTTATPSATTSKPASTVSSKAAPPTNTPVAASAPVITIAGICDRGASTSPSCTTIVTREEFERLAQVVQPEMAAAGRQRLAALYSQLLVFANAAQERGLNKSADAQEALHFAQVQALSQVLARKLQAETSKVSSEDVQKYYHEHPKQFEEASLLRLYAPRNAQGDSKPIKEEDVQAEMKKLRDRAVQGDSFESLQKLAFADLKVSGSLPPTDLKRVRRSALSSATAAVFDQQLGQVSEPISEASGLYIFQLTSKRVLTLQEASPEITSALQKERLEAALEQISASAKATFNSGYFGDGAKSAATDPNPIAGSVAPRESANASSPLPAGGKTVSSPR